MMCQLMLGSDRQERLFTSLCVVCSHGWIGAAYVCVFTVQPAQCGGGGGGVYVWIL